ncbi:MAG: DNA topoisomerase (ATP-hydrolyzing) subunit A [Ruminococcus flavefaciens]|nr:DNA topoisomerase (ATP-hydrolyzing) subunit A [Ruminococcus flavefaciens]MCM1229331.1 DNA topoisomerase (ATP-hydrolyzing) subunit A [Ruminococcus flavefaciens]
MPRKKSTAPKKSAYNHDAYIEGSGSVVDEKIADTLKKNYMPYAMSVIISRALPEIDGFKPSHRKILYMMYKRGLLSPEKERSKSANVVGETMKLNPHGDQSIYETMVRLTRGNESLLHPYIDSKGNFGKQYSSSMKAAASRYTEVKLEKICNELFRDIDRDTVDFVPNYDNTMQEPTLLPATFPTVLVNSNTGIAVSMASNVCPFNLAEICETTVALMKNPDHDIISTLKGPDFPGGAFLLYDEAELNKIYETGRGSVKLRCKYTYDKSSNCIEVTEIPYTTTVEAIINKVVDLVKSGKLREISYIRDETGIDGLKIAIDLKRGTDPDKLMQKLYRLTPLQDSYPCNFNILIAGTPKVMGVREILAEWTAFREECVRRRTYFDLQKKKEKLHLLEALAQILTDIDKAIRIIRETENEDDVVPNLMIGFGIDEIQAEYVAEIKLRNINRQYILRRLEEVDQLRSDIAEMEDVLQDKNKIRKIIIKELKSVAKTYGKPRKTMFYFQSDIEDEVVIDDTPDYPVRIFVSDSGYFKKITPQSLRMSSEQKLKEGDFLRQMFDATNKTELVFFSDKAQAYKSKASAFDDTKASVMGDYIPAKLSFDEGESLKTLVPTTDYSGYMMFFFENGKAAKVPMKAYETKTNRRKLTKAYSDKSPLVTALFIENDCDILLRTSNSQALVFNTAEILTKSTRDTQGVQVVTLKKNAVLASAEIITETTAPLEKYRAKSLPASPKTAKELGDTNQLSF